MMIEDDVELAYKKNKKRRRCRCIAVIIVVILMFLLGILIGYFIPRGHKTSKSESRDRHSGTTRAARADLREQLRKTIDAEQLRSNLRYFSEKPHIAGSDRQKVLAEELAKRWRSYGFDRVELPEYRVLLSFPRKDKPNLVTLLYSNGSTAFQTSGKMKIAEPSENDTSVVPPFLGYAPSGTVEGDLVYCNYGTVEDFEMLKNNLSVDVTGKIAIMRYGKIFRGDKVLNAATNEAKGAIIYSDPADYAPLGAGPSETFPNTPWLPSTGTQRGSIYKGPGVGDPLTPGSPSIPGVYRRSLNESGLPKIPAHPMSYGDAIHFLSHMNGTEVPKEWKGALNITYRLGPGLAQGMRVKLQVNNRLEVKSIYNVIGTIYGKQEPDRYVLMGNHRDSWVFGAVDASSGTAATTEIARGLGELLKKDWRPRRTIKMCSWGGEEFSLIGSREWVEQHSKDLATRAVTYLNIDIAVAGNFVLASSGSPLLGEAIASQQKVVSDPHGKSMYDVMVERKPSKKDPRKPTYNVVGSGSDFAQFYHLIGVPVADFHYAMGYKNKTISYPVYHSQHDTFYWMTKFIDPKFLFHKAMSQLGGSLLLQFADAPLLPMSVDDYAKKLSASVSALKMNKDFKKQNISLAYLEKAVGDFISAADKFAAKVAKVRDEEDEQSDGVLRMLNDQMVQVEKSFIYTDGLPGRKLVKHVLFAPQLHNMYGTSSFPGIGDASYDAARDGNWQEVEKQVSVALECVMAATEAIQPLSG